MCHKCVMNKFNYVYLIVFKCGRRSIKSDFCFREYFPSQPSGYTSRSVGIFSSVHNSKLTHYCHGLFSLCVLHHILITKFGRACKIRWFTVKRKKKSQCIIKGWPIKKKISTIDQHNIGIQQILGICTNEKLVWKLI